MLAGWKDSTAIEFLSGKESDHLGKDLYIFSLSVSKTELKNEKRRWIKNGKNQLTNKKPKI